MKSLLPRRIVVAAEHHRSNTRIADEEPRMTTVTTTRIPELRIRPVRDLWEVKVVHLKEVIPRDLGAVPLEAIRLVRDQKMAILMIRNPFLREARGAAPQPVRHRHGGVTMIQEVWAAKVPQANLCPRAVIVLAAAFQAVVQRVHDDLEEVAAADRPDGGVKAKLPCSTVRGTV